MEREDKEEIRALFTFNSKSSEDEILLQFNIWGRYFFPAFFEVADAPFHKDIDRNNLRIYRGNIKYFVDIAFRGAAKTTRTKLFFAFAIANDEEHYRKYIKVLSADVKNAVQIVTDIYNLLIKRRVIHFYPEIFQKTDEKRQESMAVFTTATGVKMQADSVGTDQRGDIQEAARPDVIWFDDFETRKTLRSAVTTNAIWENMGEARNGLSRTGSALYNCNYVSERGNVHKLVEKTAPDKVIMISPIKKDGVPTWPAAYTIGDINNKELNEADFAGEFMCLPSAGADVFFDRSTLDRQVHKTPIREIAGFKIFHNYDPSHRYGLGADVGGGIALDHSASVIIDFATTPSRVVATYKNNLVRPDAFGDELASQGNRFGECIIAPENNKFDMCIGRLKQIYSRIYFTEVKEIRAGLPPKTRTYGWNTNFDSKSKMMNALKKAVADGHLELSDPDLISELKSYTRDDLMDAEEDVRLTTRHFDLLMACAIAYQMINHAEFKKETESNYQQPAYERSGLGD